MKRIAMQVTALMLALVLTGCGFKSGDEFYALPRASEEFKSLENCLQAVLDSGLEYAAPSGGVNARSVRLQDLDGDGEDEALGFFRDTSGGEAPLKLYFFRKGKGDKYETVGHISGEGAAINSVVTCQFEESESFCDMVVSWQVSSGVYALSAYSLNEYDGNLVTAEMMPSTSYTRYAVADMDLDGQDELVLITLDRSDNGSSRARYYEAEGGALEETSSTLISSTMDAVDKLHTSVLADGTPAVYVTGTTQGEGSGQVVTDVLAVTNGTFTNVTLDPASHASTDTTRYSLAPDQDFDGDGVWEIPIPTVIPSADPDSADKFYSVGWYQYNGSGGRDLVSTTYYNSTDGWYLELPEEWIGHLQLSRSDATAGLTVERGIIFYYSRLGEPAQAFLAVYKNSGSDQDERSERDQRMKLLSTQDATYSIRYLTEEAEAQMSANELFNRFHIIVTDWSAS